MVYFPMLIPYTTGWIPYGFFNVPIPCIQRVYLKYLTSEPGIICSEFHDVYGDDILLGSDFSLCKGSV